MMAGQYPERNGNNMKGGGNEALMNRPAADSVSRNRHEAGHLGADGARHESGSQLALTLLLTTLLALTLGACTRQVVSTSTTLPGAAPVPAVNPDGPSVTGGGTGRIAIDSFLKAVNTQDLQGMSAMWGNSRGLAREQFRRDELEKRLVVMQCLMQHDRYRYVEDQPRLALGGRQEFLVELIKGETKAQTTFTTVQGPGGSWLVEDVDVTKLRDFCR